MLPVLLFTALIIFLSNDPTTTETEGKTNHNNSPRVAPPSPPQPQPAH